MLAFGLISGLLSAYAFLPYAIDTLYGRTRPQRASWFIWSVLASISLVAQIAEGAGASLWFAGVQTAGTAIIFLIGLWRGVGGVGSWTDICVLTGAALGLVLWSVTDAPAYALLTSIGISCLGGSVTVWKAYKSPESETLTTWMTCFVASACAMLAVGTVDWLLLAYPIYLLVLNGAIVMAIMLGRRRGLVALPA